MFRLALVLSIVAIGLGLLAFGVVASTLALAFMAKLAFFFVVSGLLLCLVHGTIERDWLTIP